MADQNVSDVSDPCQILVKDKATGQKRICGAVFPSLRAHLKSHNKDYGFKWSVARYKKEFPEFSLGKPMYVPPPEAQEKWKAARDKGNANIKAAKDDLKQEPEPKEKVPGQRDSMVNPQYYIDVDKRFEELWDQVNRDLPARQFAMEAARAEQRIEEINRRYDSSLARGDYKKCNALRVELQALHKTLKECMDFLDLTVKNRREKNQLGNDTVAQLVSNFGGTLRRMSPEKQQTFYNRVKEVRRIQAERARLKAQELLDEQIDEVVEAKPMTDGDYDKELSKFIERAKSS